MTYRRYEKMARVKDNQNILDARLNDLRLAADNNIQNHRNTRHGLWKLLSETYVWWRDASQDDGFLDKLFKDAGIQNTKLSNNKINFTPIIKLVWNMPHLTPSERASAANWNKALNSLHDHYIENPDLYRNQTVGKMMSLFDRNGGVNGLINIQIEDEIDDDANEIKTTNRKNSNFNINLDDLTQNAMVELATSKLKDDRNGIGEFISNNTMHLTDDGFTIILARKSIDGKFIIHGSSSNSDLIKSGLINVMKFDSSRINHNLRSLIEIIRIQMFPLNALPPEKKRKNWFLDRLADKSNFYNTELSNADPNIKKKKLTSARRVHILDGSKTLRISGSMIDSSPVITCTLNEPLFSKSPDLYLRTLDRPIIEALCYNKSAMLMDVLVENNKSPDDKFYKRIKITNTVNNLSKYIYFYKIDKSTFTNSQVIFKNDDYEASWSVKVDIKWFETLRENMLDPWFSGLGKHNYIIRDQNTRFDILVSVDTFIIAYSNGNLEVPFVNKCNIMQKLDYTSFNSKDFAPIFYNIASSEIIGDITLSGNIHAIVIEYKTNVGFTKISIPSLNLETNKRDKHLFYMDGPK